MRYKSMPLSIRASAADPTQQKAGARPSHVSLKLLLLLLLPALVIPHAAVAGAAVLSLDPEVAAPAQSIGVHGGGFAPRSRGKIMFEGVNAAVANYRADRTGAFSVSFTIPRDTKAGSHLVSAVDAATGGKASRVAATMIAAAPLMVDPTTPGAATPTPAPTAAPTPAPTTTPAPTATPASAATPTPIPTPILTADAQPTFPIRATFYYPWFPESWNQQGFDPFTWYTPTLGKYDSSSSSVIASHISAMQAGGMKAAITSWWGQGTKTDGRVPALLAAAGSGAFRFTLYYEPEGSGDPTVAQLTSDLTYIVSNYAHQTGYLRVAGRPVVFVYGDALDGCAMADRWQQANAGVNAYLVLKVFSGYRTCANQPDSWHQYAPSSAEDHQSGYSFAISPGFWKRSEATPRLVRDLSRWQTNVRDMVASGEPWQLVSTFSEWGEGTQIESSVEFGNSYIDVLAGAPAPTPTPAPVSTPTPAPTPTPPAGTDPVLVGAGDIASCSSSGDEATAALLDGIAGTVFTAGDNVYDSATATEYTDCYGPSWGGHKARTRAVPGNHDYLTTGATGYFGYFGSAAGDPAKGYYAYDLGNWRVYALNSNCSQIGGCGAGSAQESWLINDLNANPRTCVLAYWHHPRFSSGEHGSSTATSALWQVLYDHNAELVINGHDHDYERFLPQTSAGVLDLARGLQEIVVGTGGKSHYAFPGSPIANSAVRNDVTFGVLKLTLHPAGWDWQFVPEAGKTFTDTGSRTCH